MQEETNIEHGWKQQYKVMPSRVTSAFIYGQYMLFIEHRYMARRYYKTSENETLTFVEKVLNSVAIEYQLSYAAFHN